MAEPAFHPFADDTAVCQLADFSIENGRAALALHGSLSITRDRTGLDRARALKEIVDRIVASLEAAPLPTAVAEETTAPQIVRNPFA